MLEIRLDSVSGESWGQQQSREEASEALMPHLCGKQLADCRCTHSSVTAELMRPFDLSTIVMREYEMTWLICLQVLS